MGLVGNGWANCFRTHNELTMGLPGKYPLAPSDCPPSFSLVSLTLYRPFVVCGSCEHRLHFTPVAFISPSSPSSKSSDSSHPWLFYVISSLVLFQQRASPCLHVVLGSVYCIPYPFLYATRCPSLYNVSYIVFRWYTVPRTVFPYHLFGGLFYFEEKQCYYVKLQRIPQQTITPDLLMLFFL